MNDELLNQLIKHEGLRTMMYLDSEGIETIGVGHNLRDRPISERAARIILEDDLEACLLDLDAHMFWYHELTDVRQNVIINLCFNLGITRLKKFKRALAAMQTKNWSLAADEMLDSKWATQVGNRAIELADQMRTGV